MKTRREREREKSNYAEVSEDASQMLVCWCKKSKRREASEYQPNQDRGTGAAEMVAIR